MSVKLNLKWRPPPSWIYFQCQFWSLDLFLVTAVNISAKFLFTSIGGWVIAFCGKIWYGSHRHLGFIETKIWQCVCLQNAIFSHCAKFCANICNSSRVMSIKQHYKWKLPPSWIYFRCQFWSCDLFPVTAANIPAKFFEFSSIGGWVIAFCGKIQYGGRRHLGFLKRKSNNRSVSGMPFSVSVLNFVQIHATATEL